MAAHAGLNAPVQLTRATTILFTPTVDDTESVSRWTADPV